MSDLEIDAIAADDAPVENISESSVAVPGATRKRELSEISEGSAPAQNGHRANEDQESDAGVGSDSDSDTDSELAQIDAMIASAKKKRRKPEKKSEEMEPENEDDDDDDDDDDESEDVASVSEEVIRTNVKTRSGRKSKPVERLVPVMSDDDSSLSSESDGADADGKKKKKPKKGKKTRKAPAPFHEDNKTHGLAEDGSFVVYARVLGPMFGGMMATCSFEVSEYADADFCAQRGISAPKKTQHACRKPEYIAACRTSEERIELRNKVLASEAKPLRTFRASLICVLVANDALQSARLEHMAAPMNVRALRVSLADDLLGFENIKTRSVAPHFDFPSRLRGGYGIPMGVHEVLRHTFAVKGNVTSPKQPACLAGLPVLQNAALKLCVEDSEPVHYVCATPSVCEFNALRPMFLRRPVAPVKTNRSWSQSELYNIPDEIKVPAADALRGVAQYTLVGDVKSHEKERVRGAALAAATSPCKSWLRFDAVVRMCATFNNTKAIQGAHLCTKALSAANVFGTALEWHDARGLPCSDKKRAVELKKESAPVARALLSPFLTENFWKLERYLGFHCALLLVKDGACAKFAKAVDQCALGCLLTSRTLHETAPDVYARIAPALCLRIAEQEMLGVPDTPAIDCAERTTHGRRNRLHELRATQGETLRQEAAALLAFFNAVALMAHNESLHLVGDLEAVRGVAQKYSWARDRPSGIVCVNNTIGWIDTGLPAIGALRLLGPRRASDDGIIFGRHGDCANLNDAFAAELRARVTALGNVQAVWVVLHPSQARKDVLKAIQAHPLGSTSGAFYTPQELAKAKVAGKYGAKLRTKNKQIFLAIPRADLFTATELCSIFATCMSARCGNYVYARYKNVEKPPPTCFQAGDVVELCAGAENLDCANALVLAAPLVFGLAVSDNALFDNLALRFAAGARTAHKPGMDAEALLAQIKTCEAEDDARDKLTGLFRVPKQSALWTPSCGSWPDDVDELRNSMFQNAMQQYPSDAYMSWQRKDNQIPHTTALMLHHSTNPLWRGAVSQEPTRRQLRWLLARLAQSRSKEKLVFGSTEHTLRRVAHEDFWRTLDVSEEIVGFIEE